MSTEGVTPSVTPQWGDAFADLAQYVHESDSYAAFVAKIERHFAGTPEPYREKLRETAQKMARSEDGDTSPDRGFADSVIMVAASRLALNTLSDFVRLWAASEGYWEYYDREWWTPNDMPLFVFYSTVKNVMRRAWTFTGTPSDSREFAYKMADQIKPYTKDQSQGRGVTARATSAMRGNLSADKNDSRWTAFGDSKRATEREAQLRLLQIQRTRNYRCLHPMVRAAIWDLRPKYVERRRARGLASNLQIAGGDGIFIGMGREYQGDDAWSPDHRAMLHGSAMAHILAGVPEFDVASYFSYQNTQAIDDALQAIPRVMHGGAHIPPLMNDSMAYNARQVCDWATEETTHENRDACINPKELRQALTTFVDKRDLFKNADAYMVIARACYDRVAANGLLGVTPSCRMLGALYMGLCSDTATTGSQAPGQHVLDRVKYLMGCTAHRVCGGALDAAVCLGEYNARYMLSQPDAEGVAKPVSTLLELAVSGLLLHHTLLGSQMPQVMDDPESGLRSALVFGPLFQTLFYCKPFHPIDVRHAVAHFDYVMALVYGIAFWSEGDKRGCFPENAFQHSCMKGVGETPSDGSPTSELYMFGLHMDVARHVGLDDVSTISRLDVIRACAEQDWSIMDLARYTYSIGARNDTDARVVWFEHGNDPSGNHMSKHTIDLIYYGEEARQVLFERIERLSQLVEDLVATRGDAAIPSLLPLFHLHAVYIYLLTAVSWSSGLPDELERARRALKSACANDCIGDSVRTACIIVNNTRFARQCRESGFSNSIYPMLKTDSKTVMSATSVYGVSSHASAMFDLWIAGTRVSAMSMYPSLVGSYMDSTILPLIGSVEQALMRGDERILPHSELLKGPQDLSMDQWEKPLAPMPPFKRHLVMFYPTPAWQAPGHVALYHGHMEARKVEPDMVVVPHTFENDLEMHLLDGEHYDVAQWNQYARSLIRQHFLAAPTHVARDAQGGTVLNLFNKSLVSKHVASHVGLDTKDGWWFSDGNTIRKFYDIKYSEPAFGPSDTSLDAKIARTHVPPSGVERLIDLSRISIQTSNRDAVAILMRKCLNAYNQTQNKASVQSYIEFNAMLRDVFSHTTVIDGISCRVPDPGMGSQPIDYDTSYKRVLVVEAYQKLRLVMAVPDSVMNVIKRVVVTAEQRRYFIQEHIIDHVCHKSDAGGLWGRQNPFNKVHDGTPRLRDQHAHHHLLTTRNGNVVSAQQLLRLHVVADEAESREKMAVVAGIVPLRCFVPSSLMHFSAIDMQARV